MKFTTITAAIVTLVFCVCLLATSGPVLAAPNPKDPARYAPADAFLVVSISNVNKLTEKFKHSSAYGLYKDPAMQKFMVPSEKNIRKAITKMLEEHWKKSGVAKAPVNLEDFPWPTGSAMLVLREVTKTIKIPLYDYKNWKPGNGRPEINGYRDYKISRKVFTIVLEMGDNAADARKLLKKLTKSAKKQGALRKSETIAGTKVITLSRVPVKRQGHAESGGPEQDMKPILVTAMAWKGKRLVIGSDRKLIKDVLVRMSRKKRKSIGGSKDYKKIFHKIGKGDVTCYLNIRQIITDMISRAPLKRRASVSMQMESLGLTGMRGLGASLKITPNKPVESKLKALLSIYGKKKGLASLIVPDAHSTTPNSLLTKGLFAFVVSNHDLGKVYDQIAKIVNAMAPIDINEQAKQMMQATASGEGQAPVDLRKDIFGQLTGPVTFTIRYKKPYTDPGNSQMIIAIGTQDAGKCDNAIGRIHSTFIPDKKKQRQLHKRTIYVLGSSFLFGTPAAKGKEPTYTALAVTDNNLVISDEKSVEQAIRNIGGKGRKSIKTDSMYQLAARYLPSKASIYYYGNDRISVAKTWALAKEAGKDAGNNADNAKSMRTVGLGPSGIWANQMAMRKLGEYCDLSTLPEFDAVKKYFGATIGHINHVDEGIYMEFCSIKAPQAK